MAVLRSLPLLPKNAGIYAQVPACSRSWTWRSSALNPKQGLYQIATEDEQVDALAAICQGIAIAVQHYRGRSQHPAHQ
jgi:hypothetical protein